MRRGFTMIELIFVIVILGILAAVAIPRLAATRDDAEIAKAATNLTTLLSDIGSHYTAQGQFASTIEGMTNVPTVADGNASAITAAGKKCIKVEIVAAVTAPATAKPQHIKVSNGADAAEAICTTILDNASVKKVFASKFTWDRNNTAQTSGAGEFNFSGSKVKF